MHVTKLVGIMFVLIFILDLLAAIGVSGTFAGLILTSLVIGIFVILLMISRQPQNRYNIPLQLKIFENHKEFFFLSTHRYALAFLTPGLPFIPTIAITVNIYLIFKLSILTLVRFTIWMTLGLIMYFYYGITHSTLENPGEEIELTVDQSYLQTQQQPNGGGGGGGGGEHHQTTAVWDRHGYENKMSDDTWSQSNFSTGWNNTATATTSITDPSRTWGDDSTSQKHNKKSTQQQNTKTQPVPGGFGIFVEESQFPSWDD